MRYTIFIVIILALASRISSCSEIAEEAAIDAATNISPKQDLSMMRRAWTKSIKVEFDAVSVADCLKSISKDSGIDIQTDSVEIILYRGGDLRCGGTWIAASGWARAKHFLGKEEAWRVDARLNSLVLENKDGLITNLSVDGAVPLAAIVEFIADKCGCVASYRADHIYIAARKSLANERNVTREFKLKHGGWGGICRYSMNGKPVEDRYGLLDYVAIKLPADSYVLTEPEGHLQNYRSLRGARPDLDVKWDPVTKVLKVTADPNELTRFADYVFNDIDRPDPAIDVPDSVVAAFTTNRQKALAVKAKSTTTDEQRRTSQRLVEKLTSSDFDEREEGTQKIIQSGIAALPELLDALKKFDDAEQQLAARQRRILGQPPPGMVHGKPARI